MTAQIKFQIHQAQAVRDAAAGPIIAAHRDALEAIKRQFNLDPNMTAPFMTLDASPELLAAIKAADATLQTGLGPINRVRNAAVDAALA